MNRGKRLWPWSYSGSVVTLDSSDDILLVNKVVLLLLLWVLIAVWITLSKLGSIFPDNICSQAIVKDVPPLVLALLVLPVNPPPVLVLKIISAVTSGFSSICTTATATSRRITGYSSFLHSVFVFLLLCKFLLLLLLYCHLLICIWRQFWWCRGYHQSTPRSCSTSRWERTSRRCRIQCSQSIIWQCRYIIWSRGCSIGSCCRSWWRQWIIWRSCSIQCRKISLSQQCQ